MARLSAWRASNTLISLSKRMSGFGLVNWALFEGKQLVQPDLSCLPLLKAANATFLAQSSSRSAWMLRTGCNAPSG